MSLLTRGTPSQTLAKQEARARAKASKAGIDTAGALAVSRWNRDSVWSTMLVFPDRVDIHSARGSVTRTGRLVASVPIAEVSTVQSALAGVESALYLETPAGTLVFWTSHLEADALATLIRRYRK